MIVSFKGKEYPTRELKLNKHRTVVVAQESLQEALFPQGPENAGRTSEKIDEGIYYYCTDEEWSLNDSDLIKYLLNVL